MQRRGGFFTPDGQVLDRDNDEHSHTIDDWLLFLQQAYEAEFAERIAAGKTKLDPVATGGNA
jgi:hypothetical protein